MENNDTSVWIELPKTNGRSVDDFVRDVAKVLKENNAMFFYPISGVFADTNRRRMDSYRFVTFIEQYITPYVKKRNVEQNNSVNLAKSMDINLIRAVLNSDILKNELKIWQVGQDLDQPEDFNTLSEERKKFLLDWIRKTFTPVKTVNMYHTSYGLKHKFSDSEGGFYITNGQFKGAMLQAGFIPHQEWELNWRFRISKKGLE